MILQQVVVTYYPQIYEMAWEGYLSMQSRASLGPGGRSLNQWHRWEAV